MAAELRDRRVRDVDDVRELLGLAVIGVLPGPKTKGSTSGVQRQRLLGHSSSSPKAA